jgi:hypothetical protein
MYSHTEVDMDGIKLSINLEVPKEPEYKESLMERVDAALESLEYGTDREAYLFLRNLNNCLAKCYRNGKRSDKADELLKKLVPAMGKYGLQDIEGVDLLDDHMFTKEDNK